MSQVFQEPSSFISSTNTVALKWSDDINEGVQFVSDNIFGITGYEAQDFISGAINLVNLIKGEGLSQLQSSLGKVDGGTVILELESKEGITKWVEARTIPVESNSAKSIQLYTILNDITDRTIIEQKILEQNRYLRNISWIQSHEVRAPLSRILGIIELINLEKESFEKEFPEMKILLDSLCSSSNELDEVIKAITEKSFEGIVDYRKD